MVASITSSGLQNLTNPVAAALPGQWAPASGSADAITVSYSVPNQGLTGRAPAGLQGVRHQPDQHPDVQS